MNDGAVAAQQIAPEKKNKLPTEAGFLPRFYLLAIAAVALFGAYDIGRDHGYKKKASASYSSGYEHGAKSLCRSLVRQIRDTEVIVSDDPACVLIDKKLDVTVKLRIETKEP